MAQVGLAHIGQRELARGALQQAHAQVGLEFQTPAATGATWEYLKARYGGGKAARSTTLAKYSMSLRSCMAGAFIVLQTGQSIANLPTYQNCTDLQSIHRHTLWLTPSESIMQLLHIDSAITGAQSVSRQLTAQVTAAWVAAHPAPRWTTST